MPDVRVGIVLRQQDMEACGARGLPALAERILAAGLDHVTVGDHVSFAGGNGADGLLQATALLVAHPDLRVQTGVYLLPLRHPATVARQLSTLASLAPGRFSFGVGLGGDDPRELELCGVDPRTRGARMEESLTLLRQLLTGESVTFHGRFFEVEDAAVRPAPDPPLPIIVGGRSDAALRRAGRHADGWIGVWVSPRRWAEATRTVESAARTAARDRREWRHALNLWAGFGRDNDEGRAFVAPVMERAYAIPFEKFSRHVPCGTPAYVAATLHPYVELGCRQFNFIPEGDSLPACVEAVGAVRRLLREQDERGLITDAVKSSRA